MTVTTLTIETRTVKEETSRVYYFSSAAKAVNKLMLLNDESAYRLSTDDSGSVTRKSWEYTDILKELKEDGMAFAYSEEFTDKYVSYRYSLETHKVN